MPALAGEVKQRIIKPRGGGEKLSGHLMNAQCIYEHDAHLSVLFAISWCA